MQTDGDGMKGITKKEKTSYAAITFRSRAPKTPSNDHREDTVHTSLKVLVKVDAIAVICGRLLTRRC